MVDDQVKMHVAMYVERGEGVVLLTKDTPLVVRISQYLNLRKY